MFTMISMLLTYLMTVLAIARASSSIYQHPAGVEYLVTDNSHSNQRARRRAGSRRRLLGPAGREQHRKRRRRNLIRPHQILSLALIQSSFSLSGGMGYP